MIAGSNAISLHPFFLPGSHGDLFAMYISPAADPTPRRAVLFFPPFAEEMNRSRRCVGLQAHALAASGVAVLLVDLFGSGDSEGDFADARWEIWRTDADRCIEWLRDHGATQISLWGLRFGALLAAERTIAWALPLECLLLWQPVTEGLVMMNQFLRLRVAAEMSQKGGGTSVQALRLQAEREGRVEVAGYTLDVALLHAIDNLKLESMVPAASVPVTWFEIVADAAQPVRIASRKVGDQWMSCGSCLSVHAAVGEPFWNTVEITTAPELIRRTTLVFDGREA